MNQPIEQRITETLEKNYMPYAMSVIISRAIPDIDGFKPSHRKLLFTMYKMGLLNGNRTKSANVVGQTMKLNPHGDMAIYETMVRLTHAHQALLHPLVDSKGNFGKQYSRDMAFAAPRYTEVKLDNICGEIFKDIDKDTVDFVDNYDGTLKEPVLLPAAFPNILVNPNQGIAVGMASNICSFNLGELCETTIRYIKDKNIDLLETLPAPDFPTGAYIIGNKAALREIYETGRGSFRMRSKYRYDKKNNCIEVTEIPYTSTTEAIMDKIIELIKDNKIREITDIRDETDLSGLKLTIDIKRGTDPDKLMTKLYKMTELEASFGCNFNILIDGKPMVLGVKGILEEWLRFRKQCVERRLKFEIGKKSEKLHLLLGLRKILLDIDKAIAIIRNTEEEADVVPNLMSGFGIDKVQAEFVAEIKLRNLNKQYILKRTAETDDLAEEIKKLEAILGSDNEIKKCIIAELKEIKQKYAKERCSEILEEENVQVYSETAEIEDYNLKIFFTRDNYLKKISLVSLRSASEQKLKDDDVIVSEFESTNRSDLLLFSNKQNVYKVKISDVNDCKASALGEYLPNLLQLDSDEKIVYAFPTLDYKGFVMFAFENGKVAKIDLQSYATKLNRKKLINAYSAVSPLVSVLYVTEDADVALISTADKIMVINSKEITLKTTKNSQGIQVMKLKKGSTLKKLCPAGEAGVINFEEYRARSIPSGGYYLKGDDSPQMQLF